MLAGREWRVVCKGWEEHWPLDFPLADVQNPWINFWFRHVADPLT